MSHMDDFYEFKMPAKGDNEPAHTDAERALLAALERVTNERDALRSEVARLNAVGKSLADALGRAVYPNKSIEQVYSEYLKRERKRGQ